nr:MAG TPA: hypothetical protein [Caudoviricetes sp.]
MENELMLKLDKETTITLIEGLGKSAYAIAVAHGFRGTEQEWLDSLKGLQGEPFKYSDFTPEQLNALKGPKGEQGDNVNAEVVAKIKNLLLDNNVFVHSDSLEGIMLEYFEAQRNSTSIYLIGDESIPEPYISVNEGKINITYGATLPFQINDGEIQYVGTGNISVPLPSTTENTTIKFYNSRMKLMFTKTVEVN